MTPSSTAARGGRPGRQIDEARTQEVLQVVLDMLRDVGYERLTIDGLAARGHVSKATIYRRWQNKAEMVVAALHQWCDDSGGEPPNTGALRSDLLAHLRTALDRASGPDGALLPGVLHAMQSDPELACAMRQSMLADTGAGAILEQARVRGEVPDNIDASLLTEVARAQLFARTAISGQPADDAYLAHLVDDILVPVLTWRVQRP
jgi:AcrR family transcriptional regulator